MREGEPVRDHVKHIRHTRADMTRLSWCGTVLANVGAFTSLDHAAYNGAAGNRLLACPACVRAAVAALLEGVADDDQ
jgi:hypothetical protein